MTHVPVPDEHVIIALTPTSAECSCGTMFVISSTVADGLALDHCQNALLDMHKTHRVDVGLT